MNAIIKTKNIRDFLLSSTINIQLCHEYIKLRPVNVPYDSSFIKYCVG